MFFGLCNYQVLCLVTLGYVSYAQVKLWWCSLGMHDIFHRLLWFHTGLFIIRKVEFFTKKHMMGLFLFMCKILLTVHWVFLSREVFPQEHFSYEHISSNDYHSLRKYDFLLMELYSWKWNKVQFPQFCFMFKCQMNFYQMKT